MENKSKLSRLLFEHPIAFIAVTYPYMLFLLIGFGLFYISNLNALVQNKLPAKLPDTVVVATDLEIVTPTITPGIDMKTLPLPTAAQLASGKELFTNNCQSCHGDKGKGDGTAGVALDPKPRNFALVDGWRNGRTFFDMYNTLDSGILKNNMPAFNQLTPDARLSLIHYIRQNFMANPPAITADQLAKLDKDYKLSAGTGVPGQIPVQGAYKLLLKAETIKFTNSNDIVAKINELSKSERNSTSAKLFLTVATNPEKAVTTLLNSKVWIVSEKEFRKLISNNLVINGFSGKTLALNDDDIRGMYALLKNLIKIS